LKLYMRDRPQQPVDWVRLAEQSEYYTSAELEYLVNEAAREALADRRPITEGDIVRALQANPPSLGPEKTGRIGF
jgi:SpoVK/Ycf46/Vps4 family AAA+-type ATPase